MVSPSCPGAAPPAANKIGNDTSNMVSLTMQKKIREVREKTSSKPNQLGDERMTCLETDTPVISSDMGYADVLRNGKPKPWIPANKGRNSKLIKGTMEDANCVKVAARSIDLFTKGWGSDETCNGVIAFLKTRHNINAKCDEIKTKVTKYKCFKVSINTSYNIDFFDHSLWPLGIAVGKFFNRTKNQNKSNVGRSNGISNDFFNNCIV